MPPSRLSALALAAALTAVPTTRAQDARKSAPPPDARGTAEEIRAAIRDLNAAALKAGRRPRGPAAGPPAQPPRESTGLVPLTDLGTGLYEGKPGGLYPDGKNVRPPAHEEAGLKLAREVVSRGADGKPAADGRIVLLSIGMSNTTQEFSAFQRLAASEPGLNPRLLLVDGAQGGMTAAVVANPDGPRGQVFWQTVADRLAGAGATPAQVQAVWLKEADAQPSAPFPKYPETLRDEMAQIVRLLHDRFPNLKLVYVSPRIYGGYATTRLNPEPYAYQSGFAVKWLVEQQIKGDPSLNFDPAKGPVRAPWLSWGPYLWADGLKPRGGDGLTYAQSDLAQDGTHPSPSGREKVARLLLDFLKTDTTGRTWFLGR
jgi:hypothetical protein